MKSIIEREANFQNNSDMEVKVTTSQTCLFVCLLLNGNKPSTDRESPLEVNVDA